MNAYEYFGPGFFERAAPEGEYETFEQFCWRWIHEEREAIESLVRESLRESAAKPTAPEIPAMPDGVLVNASIVEAWRTFHSSPRPPRESRPRTPKGGRRRPRPACIIADPDDFRHLSPE